MIRSFLVTMAVIFCLLTALFFALTSSFPEYSFATLMSGNLLMLVLSLVSFFLVRRQLSGRPQAFVRGVYSATFLKLLVCMGSILLYALLNRSNIHKPTLFMLFGIYAVYTAGETVLLSKLAKQTN